MAAEFEVVGSLVYDSENDELYRQVEVYESDPFPRDEDDIRGHVVEPNCCSLHYPIIDPFDDDEYWINQREADDYRYEVDDLDLAFDDILDDGKIDWDAIVDLDGPDPDFHHDDRINWED